MRKRARRLGMTRLVTTGLAIAAMALTAVPVHAQDQGFAINGGYFAPIGQDSRVSGDVLNADRCLDVSFACDPLLFDVSDFGGFTFGGEYIVGLGKYFEVSAGVGFTQQTVPSVYEFLTHPDGSEIDQELKLRIIPVMGLVRFVPTGRTAGFQPYMGAGIAGLRWHYAESGEFVDSSDQSIFRAQYVGDGTAVGLVVLGGVRAPVGASMMLGGEVRFQKADADLNPTDFLGDKLDLGGVTYQATLTWRF
jgi:opacity protein-like surface antigen